MTRKHFEAVATAIASASNAQNAEAARRMIASELASAFKRDNTRFDRERFMRACRIES